MLVFLTAIIFGAVTGYVMYRKVRDQQMKDYRDERPDLPEDPTAG